jgi:hypothetical protein
MLKNLILYILILSSPLSYGAGCALDWSKIYFKDFMGTDEYNSKTKKMEKFYEEFHEFKGGNIPLVVSMHIPFKGDCSGMKISKVNVFRKIGKRELPGGEDNHEKHALDPKSLKYEEVPFQTVFPDIKRSKKEVILNKFEVMKGLESLGKNQHAWFMKYEILYKSDTGIDNKKIHEVHLPLVH